MLVTHKDRIAYAHGNHRAVVSWSMYSDYGGFNERGGLVSLGLATESFADT